MILLSCVWNIPAGVDFNPFVLIANICLRVISGLGFSTLILALGEA